MAIIAHLFDKHTTGTGRRHTIQRVGGTKTSTAIVHSRSRHMVGRSDHARGRIIAGGRHMVGRRGHASRAFVGFSYRGVGTAGGVAATGGGARVDEVGK